MNVDGACNTKRKKNYSVGEVTYFAECFLLGGAGIFSLAFTAVRCRYKPRYKPTSHTVPSLAVKYCVNKCFKFVACDCIHFQTFLVSLDYFLMSFCLFKH